MVRRWRRASWNLCPACINACVARQGIGLLFLSVEKPPSDLHDINRRHDFAAMWLAPCPDSPGIFLCPFQPSMFRYPRRM